MDFKEVGFVNVDCVHLAQDRDRCDLSVKRRAPCVDPFLTNGNIYCNISLCLSTTSCGFSGVEVKLCAFSVSTLDAGRLSDSLSDCCMQVQFSVLRIERWMVKLGWTFAKPSRPL